MFRFEILDIFQMNEYAFKQLQFQNNTLC